MKVYDYNQEFGGTYYQASPKMFGQSMYGMMNTVMSSTSKYNVCTFFICKNIDNKDRLLIECLTQK